MLLNMVLLKFTSYFYYGVFPDKLFIMALLNILMPVIPIYCSHSVIKHQVLSCVLLVKGYMLAW